MYSCGTLAESGSSRLGWMQSTGRVSMHMRDGSRMQFREAGHSVEHPGYHPQAIAAAPSARPAEKAIALISKNSRGEWASIGSIPCPS
jgi:hypothetical protein